MHARSTTMTADLDAIDEGIAYVRDEVMPAVEGMDGCVGLSMLVDRETGRCIVTTAWHDEQAMRASESRARSLRGRAEEILRGQPRVQEWEIAVLHRMRQTPDGACARVTWMRADPAQAERNIDVYKSVSVPAMEDLPGFCSASLMVDRATGRAVSSATYDSRESLDASRQPAAELRRTAVQENDVEILEVAEFDLVLAHLRVPEMV